MKQIRLSSALNPSAITDRPIPQCAVHSVHAQQCKYVPDAVAGTVVEGLGELALGKLREEKAQPSTIAAKYLQDKAQTCPHVTSVHLNGGGALRWVEAWGGTDAVNGGVCRAADMMGMV
jgi:hypothetical protein